MKNYEIIQLDPKDYDKCNNIWDMSKMPVQAELWRDELLSGNRIIYVYTENGEYFGEGSLAIERNDPDYSIPNRRVYFSRLVVKATERGRGIGSVMVDYIVGKAAEMGYREISIGVDKSNHVALNLYKKKGFTEVIYDGEDEHGPYYKLLKRLKPASVITYTHTLTVEQFNDLRQSVDWSLVEPVLAQKGLDHTAFLIVANVEDKPVGMARVITDYGYQVLIADVIVRPEYQGKSIGSEIMGRVMAYINENIAPGQRKMINLMSAKGKDGFYKKFGFIEHPNDKSGPGMTQWISKE